jgi:O-antigen/teichoic acid export membrane protein
VAGQHRSTSRARPADLTTLTDERGADRNHPVSDPPPGELAEPLDPLLAATGGPARGPIPASTPARHANESNQQLLRNFATAYLSVVVSVVSGLIVVPVTLRALGETHYGLLVVMLSVGVFLGIFDAGVGTAVVQQAARAVAHGDVDRQADIFATGRRFFSLTGVLAVVGTLAVVPFVDKIFNVEPEDVVTARVAIVVVGLTTAVTFLVSLPNSAVFAAGRSDRVTTVLVLTSLGTAGGQVAVALAGGGVVGVLVVVGLGAVASLAALTVLARRMGVLLPRRGRASRAVMRELLVLGWRNLAIGLGGAIAYRYDAVVIGAVLPVKEVAPYALSLNTANFTRTISTAGTNLLIPSYAHSDAVDDRERQFRLFSFAVLVSMAITGPAVVCFLAFGPDLLQIWLGSVPEQTWGVMVALNLMMLLQLPGHQAGILLVGIAKTKLLATIAIPVALVNLGLSIVLTSRFGPIGPVLGSMPQALLLEFVALPIYCCRSLGIPYARYLKESLVPLLPAMTAAALLATTLYLAFGRVGWWSLVECAAVFVVAWVVLAGVLWRREPTIRILARRAARIRRRTQEGNAV